MTSLQLQLKRLQNEAPAQDLVAKRDCSSLLFDEKEASNYTREQFFDIGLSGLSHLCKFDADFESYEAELFDKTRLELNRALLTAEESAKLDESLERMIVRLSPYFHYFACKQVLEWLIHKYKVHKYNAELLALAFLPYHANNSYGRLLKILRFQKPEWSFTEQYAKDATPVPMNVLMRVCHANNALGAFLVPALANHLVDAIRLVGDEYASQKLHANFTFFASFMINLFEEPKKVNNQLIARAMPYVGIALKSKVLPFKYAGMMIATRIVLSAPITDEVVSNILKLTLLKVKKPWLDVALDTAIVVCQTQKITCLPKKPILKILHHREELDFIAALWKRMESYDISAFLTPLWSTLFDVLKEEPEKDERKLMAVIMVEILDMDKMGGENAIGFLKAVMAALADARDLPTQILPKELRKHVHAIVIRFSAEFDVVRAEWMVRDKTVLDLLMNVCQIETHEVGQMSIKRPRRRRTSSCGSRKSLNIYDDPALVSEIRVEEELTAEEKMKNAQAQVAEQRQPFRKSVLKIVAMLEEKCDADTLEWALESLSHPNYLKKQPLDELEDFFLKMVFHVSRNPKFTSKAKMKVALAQIKLDVEVIGFLLADLVNFEPTSKRSKLAVKTTEERIATIFAGETCDDCQRRITFALEIINISNTINFGAMGTPKMIRKLFELVEKEQGKIMSSSSTTPPQKDSSSYIQQLSLVLAAKILEKSKSPSADNFVLDSLVKIIRFAHTPTVLRNALKVLTLVAPIIPNATVSQFLSLFTFMGDGVIRRDNEMTLQIFEDTLHTLFGALLKTDNGKTIQRIHSTGSAVEFQKKILDITRVFAKSLMDIPAHRRVRILRAVLSTIPREHVWIALAVLFEDFCVRWEKAKISSAMTNGGSQTILQNGDGKSDAHLDDLLLELVGELPIENQVEIVHSFLEYIVRLGGDSPPLNGQTRPKNNTLVIFDRSAHSIRTLRHFRFVVFGFVNKCMKNIFTFVQQHQKKTRATEKTNILPASSTTERSEAIAETLREFTRGELDVAEKNVKAAKGSAEETPAIQALKYWHSLSARVKLVSSEYEKLNGRLSSE